MPFPYTSSYVVRLIACLLICVLAAWNAEAQSRRSRRSGGSNSFDFYLFTLSWEPAFCASNAGNAECNGAQALIVHGLWPERNNDTWPQFCGNEPGLSDPSVMNGIMPTDIIGHEWTRHGTCSGMSADAYFALIRQAWNGIKVPAGIAALTAPASWTPDQIKQDFANTNTAYQPADIVLDCTGGNLVAVELCLGKNGAAQPCPAIKDCSASSVKILPPTH